MHNKTLAEISNHHFQGNSEVVASIGNFFDRPKKLTFSVDRLANVAGISLEAAKVFLDDLASAKHLKLIVRVECDGRGIQDFEPGEKIPAEIYDQGRDINVEVERYCRIEEYYIRPALAT